MDNFSDKYFNGMESSLAGRQGTSSSHSKEKTRSLKDKKRQSVQTLHWLKLNYCSCSDVCLPREIIYEHYLEFCKNEKIVPACKATFGKLIRSTFPNVTSKRLGARGHSKYHYNGIGIKQNSEYYQSIKIDRGITRFSSCRSNKNEQGSSKKFSLASKVGTLLPNFPDIHELNFPNSVNKEKMNIFLKMYKMHCQCILDITISGNFEEIRLFLLHFWQGFPDHLAVIFEYSITMDLIQVCDSVLHRQFPIKEVEQVPRNVNTVPGGTTATPADPSGKTEYQKKDEENKLVETINVRFDEYRKGIDFKPKTNGYPRLDLNFPDYDDEEDDFDTVRDSLASRLVSKTSTETPTSFEKPDLSSDNRSLIPCSEVKWIRNIGREVTGSNVYYGIEGTATRLRSFNEIERYCNKNNIHYDPSLFDFRKEDTESRKLIWLK
ncbi:DNA-binding protein RFX6 [Trichonephila clavata]|uniref:DNA-binding protein RFX6 n=1 Tax=Trichonephila clavata TaxID=2740835 RepID=A0A8X6HTC4_TRICU|nr:DNA-binding protein RFX6 [Trichonephila clavata]